MLREVDIRERMANGTSRTGFGGVGQTLEFLKRRQSPASPVADADVGAVPRGDRQNAERFCRRLLPHQPRFFVEHGFAVELREQGKAFRTD